MKIEKIRKINKSKMIIGGLIGLGVIGAITILPSFAKYRTTQSFNLVNGSIRYKASDMNIIAMYKSEDGKSYSEHTGRMPSNGYVINEKESYCNLNGQKDSNVVLKTIYGEHIIQNLTKGNRCYLYFDKANTLEQQKALAKPLNGPFTSVETGEGGVYSTVDPVYGGTTYYYRGAVKNNYVVFAEKCWRIIRINGNGSIRMIYDSNSTTCKPNGQGENATSSQAYNSAYNDNAYVGYMKGINDTGNSTSYNQAHANTYNSDIKTYLDNWYDTNIAGYASYIDEEAGFCNDRTLGSKYSISSSGYGTVQTYYVAYDRIAKKTNSAAPTFGCTRSDDLFTPSTSSVGNKILGIESGTTKSRPIGLITADEVVYAGALHGNSAGTNQSYYLYNGQNYWTMSPSYYDVGYARVFYVHSNGYLINTSGLNTYGVRPVINLKSTTTFTGNGGQTTPYVVQ